MQEQQTFNELKGLWDMLSTDDLFVCLDDFDEHVGRHIDRLDWVYEGYGVGLRNLEGRMFVEFYLMKELCM